MLAVTEATVRATAAHAFLAFNSNTCREEGFGTLHAEQNSSAWVALATAS